MSERLTKKQREFIEQCDCVMQDGYTADFKRNMVAIPFFFGPIQWDDWGMRSRSDAETFAQRLIDRGLIRSDKQWFYWATDAGRAALGKAPAPGVRASDGYRTCNFCGCHTNAKVRACCENGHAADRYPDGVLASHGSRA